MSTLAVNTITAETGSTITVPTGKNLVVTDSGGLYAPGTVVMLQQNIQMVIPLQVVLHMLLLVCQLHTHPKKQGI